MILVDANILIYAVNRDSIQHRAARRWFEKALSAEDDIGLAWIVLLAFLRITTHPSIMRNPLPPIAAMDYIESWLSQPFVAPLGPGDHHWPILRSLLTSSGTAGNLTSDAHLAALAIEHGGAIYSADNDFKRFAGVTHINPLA